MYDATKFMTSNQRKMLDAFQLATTENKIVAIIDHHGSGFKFALKNYIHTTLFTKVAFAKINYDFHSKNISIELMKKIMNIRFSTKGYRTIEVAKLVYDLSLQAKQNLKGNKILLVFENVDRLNTVSRLARFFTILRNIQFRCGIILRTNMKHYDKIASLDDQLLTDFIRMTESRIVTERNTPNDVANLCRAYGLKKPLLIEEISKKPNTSFTLAMTYINEYLKHSPVTQLELDLNDQYF